MIYLILLDSHRTTVDLSHPCVSPVVFHHRVHEKACLNLGEERKVSNADIDIIPDAHVQLLTVLVCLNEGNDLLTRGLASRDRVPVYLGKVVVNVKLVMHEYIDQLTGVSVEVGQPESLLLVVYLHLKGSQLNHRHSMLMFSMTRVLRVIYHSFFRILKCLEELIW